MDSCDNPACCARIFQDELSIIDWKTSNYLYVEFLYQTAAYQQALEEEYPNTHYAARWILRLGKEEGDFASWYEKDFAGDFAGYHACLELTRIHRKVEQRMREQKKLLTFRKRAAKTAEKEALKAAKLAEKLRRRRRNVTWSEDSRGKERTGSRDLGVSALMELPDWSGKG